MSERTVALVTRYLMGEPVGAAIVNEGEDPCFGDSVDVASYGVELLPEDEALDRVERVGPIERGISPSDWEADAPILLDHSFDAEVIKNLEVLAGASGSGESYNGGRTPE